MDFSGPIGDDWRGPVAESVDAGAVHRSLSWFKSRPGLQPSLHRSFGSASHHAWPEGTIACRTESEARRRAQNPVDWLLKALSRLRNLF
jgi:hypothetical protein